MTRMLLVLDFLIALLWLSRPDSAAAVSSEGTSFAAVFSQLKSDVQDGACEIYIVAKQETEVTIYEPDGGIDTFQVSQNSTQWKTYDDTHRVTDNVQTKGFIIETSHSASVVLSNYRDDGHMETALVIPRKEVEQEYMIVSFPSTDDNTCGTYNTCSFYTITAYEDDTLVQVYRIMQGFPRLLDTEVLDRHEVLTNRTIHTPDDRHYELTGYYVTSDKPLSVTAGNACGNTDTRRSASTLWSSMPPVEEAGTQYISHTLNYRGYSGPTLLRIVALSNDTTVTTEGNTDTIPYSGELLQFTLSSDENIVFQCDKPCLAAQYSVSNVGVTPGGSGVAMAMLIPTDKFANSVLFTKPEVGSPEVAYMDYLSLVYLTETPEQNPLYYDGQELQGWSVHTGEGFSSLELEVEGNRNLAHSLITAPGGPRFSALIHGHSELSKGYAYIAGYGTTD